MAENYLDKITAIIKDSREFGICYQEDSAIYQDVLDEAEEVLQAITQKEGKARVQEELGDLLQSVLSWCIAAGYDVQQTIAITCKKFSKRIAVAKQLAAASGYKNLTNLPAAKRNGIWARVKAITKKA